MGSLPTTTWHIDLILQEQDAYEQLWRGQYQQAADKYSVLADTTQAHDPSLAAWYRHWRGLALTCAGDRQGAFSDFLAAANVRSELGRPSEERERIFKQPAPEKVGKQATNLANWYRKKKTQIPVTIKRVESGLIYGSETKKAEEALRAFGTLLGLHARRPDKSEGTGPDVTWQGEDEPVVCGFELKTDKNKDGEYSKKEIAQCHDHEQWLIDKYGEEAELTIVGPMTPVSEMANPSESLQVVELDPFFDLLARVKQMFDAVEAGDKTSLEKLFQAWLDFYGLNWPNCVKSLDSRLAVDLKEHD